MSEAVQTLNGWYALHDYRSIDWASWNSVSEEDQQDVLEELQVFIRKVYSAGEARTGSTNVYTVIGHKADLLFMHFRPTLEELEEVETEFNKLRFADFTYRPTSYFSVVELSTYTTDPETAALDPAIQARLNPILPKNKYVCFYPMNKKRSGQDNWFMLPMNERGAFMKQHGLTGRKYAGKVLQIVTGSTGFDDWEWGVTLLSDDPIYFKKLVYEMRFDEVSARFAEFGQFFIGTLVDENRIKDYLAIKNENKK